VEDLRARVALFLTVGAGANDERLRPVVADDLDDGRVHDEQVPDHCAGLVLEDERVAVRLDARGDVVPEVKRGLFLVWLLMQQHPLPHVAANRPVSVQTGIDA
jgi:hypothetical protein